MIVPCNVSLIVCVVGGVCSLQAVTAHDVSNSSESSPKPRLPRVAALKIHVINLNKEWSREQMIVGV